MSITATEHCKSGQHFVPKDQITWLYLPGGGRRRICYACKSKVETINREKKNV